MSAFDPKRTSSDRLLDHLICEGDQPRWDGETEGFSGLKVDYEFVFGRQNNWQIGRFRAFENLSRIETSLSISVRDMRPITNETTSDSVFAKLINRRQPILCRKCDNPIALCGEVRVRCYEQRADLLLDNRCQTRVQLYIVARSEYGEPLSDRQCSVL